MAAEIALVHLDLVGEDRRLPSEFGGIDLAQFVEEEGGGVPAAAGDPGCDTRHKVPNNFLLDRLRQAAPATLGNHMINKPSLAYLGQQPEFLLRLRILALGNAMVRPAITP